MQYETRTHLCALVEEAGPLQRFVQQEFQEQLGLGADSARPFTAGAAKARTVRALALGHVLVDGRRCDRVQALTPGEVVMVHKALLETAPETEGGGTRQASPKPAEDDERAPGCAVEPPAAFFEYYRALLPGFSAAEPLLRTPQPLSIRVDNPAAFLALAPEGFEHCAWPVPAAVLGGHRPGAPPPALLRWELAGAATQQNLESMAAVQALDVRPGHAVLNICAVQVAKTTQILRRLEGHGALVAADASEIRALRSFRKASALGAELCGPLVAVVGEPEALSFADGMRFDRVLCDVRSTTDGAVRRWLLDASAWSPDDAEALRGVQLGALRAALRLLAPGGRLVYGTCALSPAENEGVVREALAADGGARLVAPELGLPACCCHGGIGEGMGACARLLPSEASPHLGGAFLAVIERGGEGGLENAACGAAVAEEAEEAEEVRARFGMAESLPLVRGRGGPGGRLLYHVSPSAAAIRLAPGAGAASLLRRGAPAVLLRGGGTWQLCNEAAGLVARRATLRRVALAPAQFCALLRRRAAPAELDDGPAVAVCGARAVAAEVRGGELEILTADAVARVFAEDTAAAHGLPAEEWGAAGVDPAAGGGLPDAFTTPSMGGGPCPDAGASGWVVAHGLRYRVPYERWEDVSFPPASAGLRLAEALAGAVRDPQGFLQEEAWWREACGRGHVQLEGRAATEKGFVQATGEELICRGDRARYLGHVHERCVRAALPEVLLGTDRFVVVSKPAGLPCQSNRRGDANVEGVLSSMGFEGLHIAHRLDQPVSGVLVMARTTKQQCNFLNSEATKRKSYIARVRPPLAAATMECDAPLGWDGRQAVRDDKRGKACCTRFEALGPPLPDGTQLVRCCPVQGRRHQIRAHLALVGCPIANDALYGGDASLEEGVVLTAFCDDDAGTLRGAFEASERPWCPSCAWTRRALAGDVPRPEVRGGIWLHSWRYRVANFSLDAEAPLPDWAASAREASSDALGDAPPTT